MKDYICPWCDSLIRKCPTWLLKFLKPCFLTFYSILVWESEIRTARCGDVAVTHISELDFPDLDPPCHFCCEQASTAIHDESRLQIVSGGKKWKRGVN